MYLYIQAISLYLLSLTNCFNGIINDQELDKHHLAPTVLHYLKKKKQLKNKLNFSLECHFVFFFS